MTTDSSIRARYLKLIWAGFLIFISHDFEALKLAVSRSRPSVPFGANFTLQCYRTVKIKIPLFVFLLPPTLPMSHPAPCLT